ncbi:MAG: hypothetical protein GXY33_02190 [Phycisphaerae bacterium]|nr:hypothetical protein [Phycisphaerae bacterium]
MGEDQSTRQKAASEDIHAPFAPSASPGPADLKGVERKLDEILQQLRLIARVQQHRDFSLLRLIGIVAQLLVLVLLLWTAVGLLDLPELHPYSSVGLKLLGAIALQMLAMTFFVIDRQEG